MIRRGAWYQLGHQSQLLVQEQLEKGVGVGVVVSPRDLSFENATEYATRFRALNAQVLFDPQFYVPEYAKEWPKPYPTDEFRTTIGALRKMSAAEADKLSTAIETVNKDLDCSAVLAPAVVYESGRPDVQELNGALFATAKRAGDALGLPTLATVVIGSSAKGSDSEVSSILAHGTSLPATGAYLACEFAEDRVPSDEGVLTRFASACLTLAGSGWKVLHAYAGPMALLSLGFGATGAAIGQYQNLWQFTRSRWEAPVSGGGGGKAPPRFFSGSLWGTIVCPDELDPLPQKIRSAVMTHTPFSQALATAPKPSLATWSKREAQRHLVHVIAREVTRIAGPAYADQCAKLAVSHLTAAEALHFQLEKLSLPVPLKQESRNTYQTSWRKVVEGLLKKRADDYAYLRLL